MSSGEGEIVGEIAFLDGGPRTATGRAAEALNCFEIDRAAFFDLAHRFPQLSTHLLQLVCKRVRWMTKLAADSAFLSVPDRLATRLRDLAQVSGKAGGGAEVSIFACRPRAISRRLPASGERLLSRGWQKAGLVELARGEEFASKSFARLLPGMA